ncbi:GTP cyclohydrolase II, partial [Podila humilis]
NSCPPTEAAAGVAAATAPESTDCRPSVPYPYQQQQQQHQQQPQQDSLLQIDHRLSNIRNKSSISYSTPPATPPLLANVNISTVVPEVPTVAPTLAPAAVAVAPTTTENSSTSVPVSDAEPATVVAWCTARARIPTPDGSEYFLHMYENKMDKKEHLAFVFGDLIRSTSLDKIQPGETELDRVKRGAYIGPAATGSVFTVPLLITLPPDHPTTSNAAAATKAPLVRIHSECFTGEIGHSARCDCGEQLDEAIRLMKAEGAGVVVYLRQEGRGIGLAEKLKAYNLQDLGYDTVMANLLLNHGADERTYEVAQGILQDLGLSQIRLLTNNPDKIEKIEARSSSSTSSIQVVERVPMMPKSWEAIEQGREAEFEVREGAVENKIVRGKELDRYLKVKVERMRHLIPIPTSMSS